MSRKLGLFFLGLAILASSVTAFIIWQNNLPLVSPVSLIETLIGNSPAVRSEKIIYGFFPYWNLKYSDTLNIQNLTHFAYFAIDLNADGSINKKINSVETEPGWNKLKSKDTSKLLYQSRLLGQKTIITITAMDPDTIEGILQNSDTRSTAINSIMSVYNSYKFDDINIDFEYVSAGNFEIRANYVQFIKDLRSACTTVKSYCQIDIDVFGSVAEKPRLWDLKSLEPFVDKFIVMSYDYYRTTSTQAGPIAPISGKCSTIITQNCLEEDIISHISALSKIIPSEKIILGIPFYGYEWQTASSDFLANTYSGTGRLASYQRILTLFQNADISSISAKWSDTTLSPYLVYEKDGDTYQVHFENSQSLEQKIKLVKSANLGGIAIWALGYEGESQDLWTPIKTLINP
ncbi:MAG TPA: glycosyl hydrolase family 18 protein [Candidatus Woesebacteria bacterium]|nr:glycosyl hydrolase family 18 protein [Candidatus Woesebacteria bacterium]